MNKYLMMPLTAYLLAGLYVISNQDLFNMDQYLSGLTVISSSYFITIAVLSNIDAPTMYQKGILIWVFILLAGSFNAAALNYLNEWNDDIDTIAFMVSITSMIAYCYAIAADEVCREAGRCGYDWSQAFKKASEKLKAIDFTTFNQASEKLKLMQSITNRIAKANSNFFKIEKGLTDIIIDRSF